VDVPVARRIDVEHPVVGVHPGSLSAAR
jgi:hypothetical protein